MSETSLCRARLSRFIEPTWLGADIGFGGDPFQPNSICVDLPRPYTSVGSHPQTIAADCRSLPFLDGSLDYIFSSHLIEDFTYGEQIDILIKWTLILKEGGRLLLYAPDQQKFLQHCNKTGQGINLAHKEPDYSYWTFMKRVLAPATKAALIPLHIIYGVADIDNYSWEMVLEKSTPVRS